MKFFRCLGLDAANVNTGIHRESMTTARESIYSSTPVEDVILRAFIQKSLDPSGIMPILPGACLSLSSSCRWWLWNNGNTNLKPFVSENFDLLRWYYEMKVYVSGGLLEQERRKLHRQGVVAQTPFRCVSRLAGARYNAAETALGTNDWQAIRQ